jgi:hypothetical protein
MSAGMSEVQQFAGYSVVPLPDEQGQSSEDLFQRRLNRLQSGKVSRNVLWVGEGESHALPMRDRRRAPERRSRRLVGVILYPLTEVLALATGFAGYGAALVARFQLQAHVPAVADLKLDPDLDMAVQVAAGFVLALVLGGLIGLRGPALISVKALGVVAGLLLFHNLVHLYPHLFELATSKAWVAQVLAQTRPHSLFWRGTSLVF